MANLKDLIVNGSARILGTLYAPDIKNTHRVTEFIVGTQTASTGAWTGKTEDTILYDGKNINYFLPYAGSGNASLNLTLASGTTTGAKPIYLSGTSYVTTQYNANSCINMTYNATKGAWFVNADRNTQDVTRLQWSNSIKASTTITANRVIVGDSNGYKNITANATFDISYPILYSKSAINATATGTNNWQSEPEINLANNKSGWTGTNYSVVYLVGTLNGTTFTIDSTMLTTTKPTTEDGKVYTPLGVMYSTTNCYFRPTNQYYTYKNGSFQPYGSGGSDLSRNIGEIIESILPLTDAGLHLLDGSLIQGTGMYAGFVTYIASLYNDSGSSYANCFVTESRWQETLSNYGVCGKFVYTAGTADIHWYAHTVSGRSGVVYMKEEDANKYGEKIKLYSSDGTVAWSNLIKGWQGVLADGATYRSSMIEGDDSNGDSEEIDVGNLPVTKTITRTAANDIVITGQPATVRLPKIMGKLEGTTDVTALGDLVEQYVKLPNIQGRMTSSGWRLGDATPTGPFYRENTGGDRPTYDTSGGSEWYFDASRCSSVYSGDGTNTKIHEQAINVLYYIVIATTTKTDIQVDIDEIATDLNGKVNKADLQEVQCIVETYVNGTSWYRIYSDGWCEQGGATTSNGTSNVTIDLLQSFESTGYTAVVSFLGSKARDEAPSVNVTAKNSFTIVHNSNVNSFGWYACGYIEV